MIEDEPQLRQTQGRAERPTEQAQAGGRGVDNSEAEQQSRSDKTRTFGCCGCDGCETQNELVQVHEREGKSIHDLLDLEEGEGSRDVGTVLTSGGRGGNHSSLVTVP